MLRSADSLYCSRACTGRTRPGRTVLPPEQVTARRLCTCKSSHALVALTHVPFKKNQNHLLLTVFYALLGSHHPCGHGSCCSVHNQVTTGQEARAERQRLLTRLALSWQQVQGYSTQLSALSCCKLWFCCLTFALPKWSANMTQLIGGNLIVHVRPFKKHLRQHHGFYFIKCQVTGDTCPCIPIKGFAARTYLSHCCIMDISFMISCRSDSTGTCLIATT